MLQMRTTVACSPKAISPRTAWLFNGEGTLTPKRDLRKSRASALSLYPAPSWWFPSEVHILETDSLTSRDCLSSIVKPSSSLLSKSAASENNLKRESWNVFTVEYKLYF